MSKLEGRGAWILLTALLLTAVIGFEQGLVRALAAAREATPAATSDPNREPVPMAQPLAALPIDEAQVRQIARQEAEAAIARSRPKKVQPAPESDAAPDVALDSARPAPGGKLVMVTPPSVSLHPSAAAPAKSPPAASGAPPA